MAAKTQVAFRIGGTACSVKIFPKKRLQKPVYLAPPDRQVCSH